MQLKEEAVFTLKFDGKPVINELGEMEQRLNELKESQKAVERGTKEWAENKAEIKELEASIKSVREEMGVSGMTVRQLEGYYKQLNREIKDLTPGTEAYLKKAGEITEVNTVLNGHRQTMRGVNEEIEKQPNLWERAKSTALGFLAGFSATELLERAFGFVRDGIKSALELSDMMGSVAKATGKSTEQVQDLANELDKIDTRTTKESLMDIAQIGGQLGVANEELLGFIRSTDMAAVALGDEFSGGAEEAADKLGGLKKLFNQTEALTYGDAINRIGSAINELGADGAATGPVIAEFTARMGQLGDLSPQITQTMGLGAAFQELGLTAEISAGGLSNILLTAAKSTDLFAQQLGYTDDEFKKIINTDPNRFLLELAAKFKDVPADQLATRLYDLGIKSQEATKVMSLLKDQTQLVTDKQTLANKAFADGTSLQKEFNTMNSTAAAEYEKSQKAIALIATEVGQALLPAITKGAQGLVAFVNIIRAVPEFVSENRTTIAALAVAIAALNGELIVSTANMLRKQAVDKASLIWTEANTAAQWLLNAAMTANPIGLVVAAVALLVAGFTALYNNSTTVRGIISGVWEAMKTGVGIVGDVTEKCLTWLQKGLEPLRPVLEMVKSLITGLWNGISSGLSILESARNGVANFVSGGISRIGSALEPVRTALANFWSLIDQGVTKIKSIGSAITSFLHVDELVSKVKSAASQIGDAFNKGYGDKLEADRPKQLAAHQQMLDKKKVAEQKGANELVTIVTDSDQKALDKKAAQADKHRQAEAKKAADAAKKEADEAVKASNEGLKKIEDLRIASIKDDLERAVATIRAKRDAEVEAMATSKASAQVKAVWEQALNEQMIRDIAKAEDEHRKKKEKDDAEAEKRTLDLKIKLSGDEKADKLQKLADVAAAQTAQVKKDITDETQKAQLLKQINDNLIQDKAKVEDDFRRKKQQEETALQNTLYQATVADANNRLALAGSNAQAIYNAKKTLLDAEYQFNQQKLQREAAEEKAKNQELIQDADRRAQADKAIDDRLKSQLKANDVQYENDKTTLTVEKTAARKKNQEEFFTAIKGLMQGDFTTFSDLLTKKLAGEKKQLTDAQKANIDKIDTVGSYTVMAVQALSALNTAALNKELGNINKEKTTQLAAWKDKYDKGLINKDQYEKGVDRINKEAADKEKQARLDSFKRQQKLDIAMAIINGLQAALKSLAMFGWPIGLISAAGAAVAAGIQIAAIKSQQPPSMRRGGLVNAGVPEGPRHGSRYGESGLAITRRDTGEEVAEMEGGEPVMVLSRNTYSNNRRVVDSLMHSSLHRNGAPIMQKGGIMFEDGGAYDYENAMQSRYSTSSGGSTSPVEPSQTTEEMPASDMGGSPGSDWMADAGAAADDMDTSSYQAEIDKSTELMESIAKNTLATVDGLKLLNETISLLQQQQRTDSSDLQSFLVTQLTGLRTDLATGLDTLSDSTALLLGDLQKQVHTDLTDLQTAFKIELPSIGDELATQMAGLNESFVLGLLGLRTGINVDMTALGKTTQLGFDTLQKILHQDGLDLQKLLHTDLTGMQVSALLSAISLETLVHTDLTGMQMSAFLSAASLEKLVHTDLTDLQKNSHLDSLDLQKLIHTDLADIRKGDHQDWLDFQKLIHTDLTDGQKAAFLAAVSLEKLIHTDLSALQLALHTDLSDLDKHIDLNLTDMQLSVHNDLEAMKLAQALQLGLLRSETKQNLQNLQLALKTELENLQKATHTDLADLQNLTQAELRTVQSILSQTKSEQGYQSTLLRIISEKNLTISVQNVINIQNQIDVVADKSNLK